jgi:hypothetical protein
VGLFCGVRVYNISTFGGYCVSLYCAIVSNRLSEAIETMCVEIERILREKMNK